MYKWIFCLLLLCGCVHRNVTVQTQYFSLKDLASYYVDTPDPLLNDPPIGQRLIIKWDLRNEWDWHAKIQLKIRVRYDNKEETCQEVDIYKKCGEHLFTVTNADYFETGGIQTYKVEIIGDGVVIGEWKHPLWRELIRFNYAND